MNENQLAHQTYRGGRLSNSQIKDIPQVATVQARSASTHPAEFHLVSSAVPSSCAKIDQLAHSGKDPSVNGSLPRSGYHSDLIDMACQREFHLTMVSRGILQVKPESTVS